MPLPPRSGAAASALTVTVLAAGLLSGCASGPKVMTDKDPAVDLDQYKTFGYHDKAATDRTPYSTLLTAHLKRATRAQLEQRGYSFAEDSPDLRVNFILDVADRQELRSSPSAGRLGHRPWSAASYDLVEYRQGTLRIDLVDARRNSLVWQGIARDRIDDKAAKNPGPAVDAVVGEIFDGFPAGSAR